MTGEQNNCMASQATIPSSNGENNAIRKPVTAPATTVHDWDYEDEGECGPNHWPVVCSGGACGKFSALAAELSYQSPIDLQLGDGKQALTLSVGEPLQFVNYANAISGQFLNTGRSVQFVPETRINAPEIYGGELDQHYRFIQYHYHWAQVDSHGSEHTLDGQHFPAELHLVHQGVDDPTKLAVLGVFLQLSQEGKALEVDAQALPHIQTFPQKTPSPEQLLQNKLPANKKSFARYQGSLTTPPCSENVTWTVFTEPVGITPEQLALLRSIKDCRGCVVHKNCRPVQQLNGRKILRHGC